MRRKLLIVGLGNVGVQYANTRHNVGFCVVDELARLLDCSFTRKSAFHADVAQHAMSEGTCVIAKPTQFMNNSGNAVSLLRSWYSVADPADLVIITDNMDLPVGKARLKRSKASRSQSKDTGKRGAITHNGIRSVVQHIGTTFTAMYIGIGASRGPRNTAAYVLSRWDKSENENYKRVIDACAKTLSKALEIDFDAMSHMLARELQVSQGSRAAKRTGVPGGERP